ncbi:MAG: response regulator [Williamsia sp.]|nr:response regulator [Williamsia sp.]
MKTKAYNMVIACKNIVGAVLLSILAFCASGQPKCKVEYYSTEQGLSHQAVTAMLKDREGFMWFGSWDGINRFDGHTFVSYKSLPGDHSQLGNDRIDQIVEDQSGHLWIQAYDRQIYRFDKKTERFLPLSVLIDTAGKDKQKVAFTRILAASNGWVWLLSADEGLFCVPQDSLSRGRFIQYKKTLGPEHRLPSNRINFFYEDREHRIWIGTSSGLCCLEQVPSPGIYKNSGNIPAYLATGISLTSYEEDAHHVYFSTADGNLITYDKQAGTFSTLKIGDAALHALCRSKRSDVLYVTTSLGEMVVVTLSNSAVAKFRSPASGPLFSLYEDHTGILWIEPEKSGVIRFNPASHAFQSFSQKVEDPSNIIGNRFKVFEDNNKLVWINLKGGGFGYYDTVKASIEFLLDAADMPNYRLPAVVYSAYYDKAGILWLRTYGRELTKIIFQQNAFKQQRLVEPAAILADNEIRGMCYDNKGRLWMGAKSGKLYVRQQERWVGGLFLNEPAQGFGQVYTIFQDSRDRIWLGTKKNGLFVAIPANGEATKYRVFHYLADERNTGSLTSNQIYALAEDRQGRIWIGTFDKGMMLATDDHDSVRFVHSGPAFQNYPKENFQKVRRITLDSAGHLWVGTTDGLMLLDADNRRSPACRYVTYSKIPGDAESLGNNDVQFILRDSRNRMWLATSGGGFCQAIGREPFASLRFKNYTTKDGMPNDYVLSCAEDKGGHLWIATENGLARFDPDTKSFRNYDSYDGLPRVGFSESAVCRLQPGGQLVFGTTDGYISFDPGQMSASRIPANIALTNLQVNNEDAGPGMNEQVLKTDINYTTALTLKHDQNILSIDYAILDHRAGNRQAFAYRLVGFDSAWHGDRQLRRATYTNLPPGHYVFEVKSLSADLYLNAPYRRLAITILPPPWKTGWAYLLYAVLAGVLLFFIRRYAAAMIRLRNKIAVEQKLAALKLNFFTNISHELRTPLTLIVNPLEQLARQETLSPQGNNWVEVARKNANRMVRFVNQLLDLRKVQSEKTQLRVSRVEIVGFVREIMDHFTEAARSKRIKLEVSSEQKELIAWVDAEKLDVVVYNLLGNAIKFTPAGKRIRLSVRSLPEKSLFSIAVHDQGPGVEKEKLEQIFELFHEANEAAGTGVKGTGIGLALSREFVNLHGGRIWASNNEAGGLTVTAEFKVDARGARQHEFPADLPKTTVLEKPIEQQILPAPAFTGTGAGPQAPLVLLVEDNDDLRQFIRGQLSEHYRVETARDGEEGLKKAIQLVPDLIISDIMMPVMNGIGMLDRIKNDVNTSHIPVVLLSAKYSIESQLEGLKYGADCYITKPFNNEFLIASVDNLLRQRKRLFESLMERKKGVELSPAPVVITSKDETFLREVIRTVETKMADPDFDIDLVAGSLATSRTTFYKKFKSLTGLAPVEFVRDMRLQRARQLLDAGGNNISEVAYLVGFGNPKYFSTCFKEKYHVSPSEYLKTNAM